MINDYVDRLDRFVDRGSDHLSPLLLRNIRQSVRSRAFLGVFALMLFFSFMTALFGYFDLSPYRNRRLGTTYFGYLYFILNLVCFICVPGLLGNTLRQEKLLKLEENLIISNLSPFQLVRGNLGTGFVMICLVYAALTPFIMYTYLLQGLDQVTIAYGLLLTFFISLQLCQLSITSISIVDDDRLKMGMLMGLIIGALSFSVALTEIVTESPRYMSRWLRSPGFYIMAGFWISNYLTTFYFLYRLGVSAMTDEEANRSTGVRMAFLIYLAVLFIWGFGVFFVKAAVPGWGLAFLVDATVIMFMINLSFGALLFWPEQDNLTRRQVASFHWFKSSLTKKFAYILGPGGNRGVLLIGIGFFFTLCLLPFTKERETISFTVTTMGYVFGFIGIPCLLGKKLFPQRYHPRTFRVILVVGICFISIATMIFAAILGDMDNPILLFNPIWSIANSVGSFRHREMILFFSICMLVVSFLVYLPEVKKCMAETWRFLRNNPERPPIPLSELQEQPVKEKAETKKKKAPSTEKPELSPRQVQLEEMKREAGSSPSQTSEIGGEPGPTGSEESSPSSENSDSSPKPPDSPETPSS